MPLINSSLPNLIQGVSQQPDPLRYDGQCTEQINGYSSIVEGLVKRPNTRHVSELKDIYGKSIGEIKENTQVYFIDTRSDEKYAILIEHNAYVNRIPLSNWATNSFNWDVTNATVEYGKTDAILNNKAIQVKKDSDNNHAYITRSGADLFRQGDTIVVSGYVYIGQGGPTNTEIKGFAVGNPNDPDSFVTFTNYPQNFWLPFKVVIRIKEGTNAANNGKISGIQLVATTETGSRVITNTTDTIYFSYVRADTTSVLSGYNLETGAPCYFRVNGENGVSPYPIPEDSYLRKIFLDDLDLRLSTVGDTTFIVNPNRTVGLSNTKTGVGTYDKSAFVYCKQGDYQTTYTITLRGNFAGGTSAASATLSVTIGENESRIRGNVSRFSYFVQSVSVVTAGTGYSAAKLNALNPSSIISVNSPFTLKTVPRFNFSVNPSTGAITGVQILEKGKIENSSNNRVSNFPSVTLDVGNPTEEVAGAALSQYKVTLRSADDNYRRFINTDYIISDLYQGLTGGALENHGGLLVSSANITNDFFLENTGNLLRLTPKNDKEFTISVEDGAGNSFLGLVYKEVDSITDLPTFFQAGYVVKVRGDQGLEQDDYYVKFVRDDQKESGAGNGSWVETVAPNITAGLDNSQAPQKLELFRRNTFNLDPIIFADRLCGDDFTNPHPSFAEREVRDVFYFKDRLGFLIDDGLVLSEQGIGVESNGYLEYNFYRTTVTTILDSDPIDVVVNSNKVINLRHAEPLQDRLLLFSDGQQFSLEGGAILSGATVSISPTTALSIDDSIKPNLIGGSIYFPFKRGSKCGVTEYQVDVTNEVYTGNEITQQVPRYIEGQVLNIEGSSKEEVLVLNTDNSIWETYVNKWYLNNNSKILNSWFKFKQSFNVKGYKFVESDLYMIGNMPYRKALPNLKHNADGGAITVYPTANIGNPQLFYVALEFVDGINLQGDQEIEIQLQDFRIAVPDSTTELGADGYTLYENKNPDPDIAGLRLKATIDPSNANVLLTTISVDDLVAIGYGNLAGTYNQNPSHALVFQWAATSHIIKMPLDSGLQDPNGVNVLLDARLEYTLEKNDQTITLPYNEPELGQVKVVTRYGVELPVFGINGNVVTLTSAVQDDVDVYVGITYKMTYQFSELIFRMPQGNSKTPTNAGDLMVRNGSIYHTDTNKFTVSVTPNERDTIVSSFDASTESGSFQRAGVTLNSGFFKFPVVSSGEDTEIVLEADGFLPASFQSAEFESFVKPKSSRYGG